MILFGEKLKKASKNITVSRNVLSETREKMLRKTAPTKERSYFGRVAVSFVAIAAVLCIGIFGTQVFHSPTQLGDTQAENNLFSISAYAYAQQEDGQLKQKEINLNQEQTNHSEEILAIRGGENNEYELKQIKMLGFKCEGESISRVDFKIDNGVLKVPNEKWAKEKHLNNLEPKGKTITVDYESGAPDEVYWESDPFTVKVDNKEGMQISDMKVTITATAHFKDGSMAEKSIVYNGAGTIKVMDAE